MLLGHSSPNLFKPVLLNIVIGFIEWFFPFSFPILLLEPLLKVIHSFRSSYMRQFNFPPIKPLEIWHHYHLNIKFNNTINQGGGIWGISSSLFQYSCNIKIINQELIKMALNNAILLSFFSKISIGGPLGSLIY